MPLRTGACLIPAGSSFWLWSCLVESCSSHMTLPARQLCCTMKAEWGEVITAARGGGNSWFGSRGLFPTSGLRGWPLCPCGSPAGQTVRPRRPQAHLALASAFTDLVLSHPVWGGLCGSEAPPLCPAKAGPLGQESSGRQENSGLAVTASLALPASPTQVDAHTGRDGCSAQQCPSVPAAPTPREPDSCGESPAARHFPSLLSAESETRSATLCQPRAGERVRTQAHTCCSEGQVGASQADGDLLGGCQSSETPSAGVRPPHSEPQPGRGDSLHL